MGIRYRKFIIVGLIKIIPTMNIYAVIDYNINTITSLDPTEYPELTRLQRKTSVILHLYAIMTHMLSYSSPMWSASDKRYFLFSERYLVAWNKVNGGTGDLSTWQSHKVFLLHAGLIKTHVVIGEQTDPILQRIWATAVTSGNHSETLWSVPLYTSQVLNHAEQIAKKYREKHVNLTHITKKAIARAWDQKTADGLYRSSKHVISSEDKYVEKCLRKVMKTAVAKKGYLTLDELYSLGLEQCMKTAKSTKHEYEKIIQKLLDQKRLLIDSAGFEYHPIRKRDREYAIPADHKGFIITKKE